MARKTLNRQELRAQAEAAETTTEQATNSKKKRTTSKTSTSNQPPMKAYWGVFNHLFKRVALFEYRQRGEADAKAKELTTKKDRSHFVQLVKE